MEGHFHFILNGKDFLKKKKQKSIILKDFSPLRNFEWRRWSQMSI